MPFKGSSGGRCSLCCFLVPCPQYGDFFFPMVHLITPVRHVPDAKYRVRVHDLKGGQYSGIQKFCVQAMIESMFSARRP